MGLLDGSVSANGSVNSAENSSQSTGYGWSDSYSRTYGTEASIRSSAEAIRADERQRALMYETMGYNTNEAMIQRAWQEQMANTIYTRSVKNMIEAGINPILAASHGLSAATVGSGASANISTPSTFMGQTFADQISESHSGWNTKSTGSGKSSGSSWGNSESGLATGLGLLAEGLKSGLNALSSAKLFDITIGDNKSKDSVSKQVGKQINNAIDKATGGHGIQFSDSLFDMIEKKKGTYGVPKSKTANGGKSW